MEEFESFREGCASSFRVIYDSYHQILYRYAQTISNDDFEAEEVVQEVFIAFFNNRNKINEPAGIYPYLFTLTKRLLIMRFRSRVVKARFNKHLEVSWDEGCYSTEEKIIYNDLQEFVDKCVDQLPEKQKEIYKLNKTNGMSYKEIARLTGVSIHTVKNQLIAASKKIKPKIEKYYLTFLLFFFY
ncbi:RNA polymerase sigma-70 factor [Sphingobacterium sp. UT-1RO-CII-1]|uniref:RNA polymerase sigma factor n=1 Tax=Sphingobacterium sp. UT-1RO-CII-1 TaxID=2995225 RepID=UPI00227CE9C2|nr:RNA polymerase sigma-70 factor [Sphingobacterium sp. UT-1RO-CII-1]MCY4780264.1 RNA polymerase sigma-70 factor [Sphingobacterium sp. UT-1RO-CII-1]